MTDLIEILPDLHISTADLDVQFSRSGGPGGQNVNKVASRVQILFRIGSARGLTDDQRATLRQKSGWYTDSDDAIHCSSQETRSQWKNRELALRKLVHHLQRLLRPRKKRRPTASTAAGRERRLRTKKRTGEKKKLRRSPAAHE
jgi:ribosome-associated protein